MPAAPEPISLLLHHPLTPAPMIRSLEAGVRLLAGGSIEFSYLLLGDMVRLRIPMPDQASRRDGLWQHTCFEAFVACAGEAAYREFNFSPSGQWAAYAFSSYRQAEATVLVCSLPSIRTQISPGRLELVACISQDALPTGSFTRPLRIGLTAVIESADTCEDNRSYWALRHTADHPDFHRADSFVMELPAASISV